MLWTSLWLTSLWLTSLLLLLVVAVVVRVWQTPTQNQTRLAPIKP